VRLGFAVAAHVDPDVLLVDEVLAVGDEAFAAKCLAKVAEFQAQVRTILFVTHGLDQVSQVCDRAVVLNQGRVLFDGEPAEAVSKLRAFLGTSEDPAAGRGIAPAGGGEQLDFHVGDKLAIDVLVKGRPEAPAADLRLVVTGPADYPMVLMGSARGVVPAGGTGHVVRFLIPAFPSLQGLFSLSVALIRSGGKDVLDARRFGERIRVYGPATHGLRLGRLHAQPLATQDGA